MRGSTAPPGTGTSAGTSPAGEPPGRGPVWPVTLTAVLLGLALLAWDLFAALINTAPFFGDRPGRDRVLESAATLLTALVPVALLCVLGLLGRSRWGLLFLALPALVAAGLGLSWLGQAGDPADPDPTRPLRPPDLFADLTRANWLVAAVLLVVLAALLVVRRRRRSGRRDAGREGAAGPDVG